MPVKPLPAEDLTAPPDAGEFRFATTAELPSWDGPLGHRRAVEAIDLALSMPGEGYHLFVMGAPGTGRTSLLRQRLLDAARERHTPDDWLYVNRFDDPIEPVPLSLPPGCGRPFASDVDEFIDAVLASLADAASDPDYQRRHSLAMRGFGHRCDAALEQVAELAKVRGVAVLRNGEALSLAPLKDGEPSDEGALNATEREAFTAASQQVESALGEALQELPQWRRQRDEALRVLAAETVGCAIDQPLATLLAKYRPFEPVIRYLRAAEQDLSRVLAARLRQGQDEEREPAEDEWLRRRYRPRLLIGRAADSSAPVIHEPNPTLPNLFGRIEYATEQGMLVTDHHRIYPGALHRANGGFLILEAAKVLEEPAVWSALKRAMRSGCLRIEAPIADQGAPAVATLRPAAMPLDLKIALVGSQDLYYGLRALDGEFPESFGVLAEFESDFPREAGFTADYANLLGTLTAARGLPALTAPAVAALCDVSSRLVGHRRRLSPHLARVIEVAQEADRFRSGEGADFIDASHVFSALNARRKRMGREAEYLLRDMLDGVVLIDTEGMAVGRANALTLTEIGDVRSGMPARVTATVCPGVRGVVDIEREAELGQAIHSKGIMILAGYLGQKYARRFPLAISANLALEQSYGYVDGDSAALAELCALISALTGVPLRQSCAVTASINQYGDIQAVGGVNEKIEGFFELCAARSLKAGQGVVIPWANRDNLVLRQDVVAAVRAGLFAVYPVRTVDEALELLSGKPAAAINELALSRLEKYAAVTRAAAGDGQPP